MADNVAMDEAHRAATRTWTGFVAVLLLAGLLRAQESTRVGLIDVVDVSNRELAEVWGSGVLNGPVPEPWPMQRPSLFPTDWTIAEPDNIWLPRIATTIVSVDDAHVRMARLSGAELLFVNGEAFVGDPERRGYEGVPVALRAGANELVVSGFSGAFELQLWEPESRIVLATWDVWYPRAGAYPCDLVVPLFNASLLPCPSVHSHYDNANLDDDSMPRPNEWRDGGAIAPLCLVKKGGYLLSLGDSLDDFGADGALFPVCAFEYGDTNAARRVFRVRKAVAGSMQRPPRPARLPVTLGLSSAIVYGTQGDAGQNAASLAVARFLQQLLWYQADIVPHVLSDEVRLTEPYSDILDEQWTVILIGNEATNAAWRSRGPGEILLIEATSASALRQLYRYDLLDAFEFGWRGEGGSLRVR